VGMNVSKRADGLISLAEMNIFHILFPKALKTN
jgi:hypothetical protein